MSTTFDDPAEFIPGFDNETFDKAQMPRKQTYTRQEVIDLLLDLRYGFETENPFIILDDLLVMV